MNKKKTTEKENLIELLAPAGNLEKLKYAFHYGADAVYAGVPDVSLRVRINNFDKKSIKEGVSYAHKLGKKIYVTVNIYAHNNQLEKVEKHLAFLKTLGVDGVIISDPGIIELAKEILPQTEIHLSTQANATNWRAVKFWHSQGVKRVILAREVTLSEIKEIKEKVLEMELEYFIHGAMCMAYSGRCILSKWMTGRSANLGDCSQPCRWQWKPTGKIFETSLIDDQERFEMDIEEDDQGTYFFNSKDMKMIEHLDELMKAGVSSFKIEGRAKSVYYLAIVVRAYREVMDAIQNRLSKAEIKKIISKQSKELEKLANRGYTTGFLFGNEPEHNFSGNIAWEKFKFVGEVVGQKDDLTEVRVHNEIALSDKLEAISPTGSQKIRLEKIYNNKKEEVAEAHGGHDKNYYFKFNKLLEIRDILRKKTD